jgi:hypothetical protein
MRVEPAKWRRNTIPQRHDFGFEALASDER